MFRHLGKNVVIALALVAAGFLVAWLRFRPYLGSEGRYTDGVKTYDVAAGGAVRYAVWDRPRALGGDGRSEEAERRPTVSPDGRYLVFAVGERGLGADLYIAELVDGLPIEPRPLALLNSGADEWAPRFGQGALYFASDRVGTAGGLDLYRATYDRGLFEPPMRIGGGLNSAADDTDPAPVPGGEGLVFASDRGDRPLSHFDLFLARPGAAQEDGAARPWTVELLDGLATNFDERDPAFTADGRTLFFASDREGGAGGFDLYRSALGRGGWVKPVALEGLNSAASERGPDPSRDGFSLTFGVERDRGATGPVVELQRARTLELFRTPGRPVGWIELVILAVLLLVALLAWLAKRWEQLEVLYKCLLVSLVVHLLLMWWLRDVYPEGGEYDLAGESNRIRVRMVSNATAAAARNAERGGDLEVARAESAEGGAAERFEARASRLPSSAVAQAADLSRARRAPSAAPVRRREATPRRAEAARSAAVVVEVPREAFEPMVAEAEALALGIRDTGLPTTRPVGGSPNRAAGKATVAPSEASPQTRPLARAGQGAGLPAAPVPAPTGELRSTRPESASGLVVGVAGPHEALERLAGTTSELSLDAPAGRAHGRRSQAQIPRGRAGVPDTLAASGQSGKPVDSGSLPRGTRGEPGLPSPLRSRSATAESRPARDLPAVALADVEPAADSGPERRGQDERVDLLADVLPATFAGRGPRSSRDGARRFEGVLALPVDPRPRPGAGLERGQRRTEGSPGTSAHLARGVERSTGGDQPLVTLALVTLDLGEASANPRESGVARALADGPFELEVRGFDRARVADGAGPSRRAGRGGLASASVPAPTFRPLATGDRRGPVESGEPTRLTQWEHTPYRSRTGVFKLRALEQHGGDERTEAAVAAGLEYLASRQRRGGYWGDARDRHSKYRHVTIGKTGLVLLAFMGAGHTPASGSQFSEVTDRALEFLVAVQDERTGHFGDSGAYSHAIATYALAECFALTSDDRLGPPLERAVAWILRQQMKSADPRIHGGWGYYFPDGRQIDRWPRASVSAWQVMALESARLGGLEVPDPAFADARAFLLACWDGGHGAFRYSHDPGRLRGEYPILPGSTPASLFALSLLGEDVAGAGFGKARAFVLDRAPRRYRYTGADDFVYRARGNLYFWYYASLALFRVGGEPWARWNESMKGALLPAQEVDGSWPVISVYADDYAGDTNGDRVYSTAMCVLTLEVYYRYFTPLLKVE
jgi:WD40-like Beta Propeller Repeat